MSDQFAATAMLFGQENLQKLKSRRVAVFGIGGVGGSCAEALCRSGIGAIDIFDGDIVDVTNINRQIIATLKTVGLNKVDVMLERLKDINPEVAVGAFKLFYLPENAEDVDLSVYDHVIDAVDAIPAKLELVCRATALNVPIISSMGAACRLDPAALEVADIYETSVCPLARIMRSELRKRGVPALKVVYSKEPPVKPVSSPAQTPDSEYQTPPPSPPLIPNSEFRIHRPLRLPSNAFVPPAAGLLLAAEVVKDLLIM